MTHPPSVELTVRDGQMGLIGALTSIDLVVGVSSAGTVATLYYHTDPNDAQDELGYGPLTETGLGVIEASGAALLLKLTGSVAATNSSVTATRIGSSVGTITISGTAYRDYRGTIEIMETTSALGSGKFRYSLDNRNEYSEWITIPSGGTYSPSGSGITFTFALQSGTPDFEVGDLHTFTCTCAHWNTTNLSAGITALLASSLLIGKKIRKVYFTGIPVDAATAATNAAAIATHMATLESRDHFARALMDCGSLDTTANVLTNYVAAFSDTRVGACYGRCEMTSPAPIPGFGTPFISCLQPVAIRASLAPLAENLGRVKSGVLPGVVSTTLGYDEEATGAFTADNKIITLRTNRNLPGGAYISTGFLKSPVGSDFLYWDWGVVIDEGCTIIVAALALWTLETVRSLAGGLHPVDAQSIKQSVDTPLGKLTASLSEQKFTVATAYDFVNLRKILATWRAVPKFPLEGAEVTVGLASSLTEAA